MFLRTASNRKWTWTIAWGYLWMELCIGRKGKATCEIWRGGLSGLLKLFHRTFPKLPSIHPYLHTPLLKAQRFRKYTSQCSFYRPRVRPPLLLHMWMDFFQKGFSKRNQYTYLYCAQRIGTNDIKTIHGMYYHERYRGEPHGNKHFLVQSNGLGKFYLSIAFHTCTARHPHVPMLSDWRKKHRIMLHKRHVRALPMFDTI